ncbi:MAG: HAMP domain-containing histidine kinase, partial [Anaerolineales bacterium]|nr:HAMP domain-containing histidine kinase [Anaerolineales bacterium]
DFLHHPLLPETRAGLAVPILLGDSLLGVLGVQARTRNRFSDDDVQVQKTLASQVAVAVQNAYLYAEQLETSAKLRTVDRLKTEFLASMSHELRTPLNSIIGFADVLLSGIDGELSDRMEEDINLIRTSGYHLRDLIGDILDMSKIEAGRVELQYETVNVQKLFEDVVNSARISADKKEIALEYHLEDDIDTIVADRTCLRQILWNIVGNAIKFTDEGSVKISAEMRNKAFYCYVRDTGIGIHDEDIPIVFEQFRQVDASKASPQRGTGLGMPISKRLVELHGGQIGLQSHPGAGTTFWFSIPQNGTPGIDK